MADQSFQPWRRRAAAQDRAERDGRFQDEVVGPLVGLPAKARPGFVRGNHDIVGWCRVVAGTVKGADHVCLACGPDRPGAAWAAVQRVQLAAKAPCTICSRRLEDWVPAVG
jgi:hypothetical protein